LTFDAVVDSPSPKLGNPGVGGIPVFVYARFFLLLFDKVVKLVLSGVPNDTSDPSGLEIDILRVLRLIDDLFFFSTFGLSLAAFMSGPGDLSPFKPSSGAGVVGVGKASLADGLPGTFGGDVCVTNVGGGSRGVVNGAGIGGWKTLSGRSCVSDFAVSGFPLSISSTLIVVGGAVGGGCGSFAFGGIEVSILSCFEFWPDIRLLRTPPLIAFGNGPPNCALPASGNESR
jgi:hypothetical protein